MSTGQVRNVSIDIPGLKPFIDEMKALGPEAAAAMKRENVLVAQSVRTRAIAKADELGSVAAKAAPSIRVSQTVNYASVRLGGRDAPYALGAEFGSIRFKQFKPYRGNGRDAGYFLYPTIREMEPEILVMYSEAFVRVSKEAFPD